MVEVFKTNITDAAYANLLLDQIHANFTGYKANFDLQDCDKILRVKSSTGFIQTPALINFLEGYGCFATVLPDEVNIFVSQYLQFTRRTMVCSGY